MSICLYLVYLFAGMTSSNVLGQAKTGHFRYDLISYDIVDTQKVQEGNIDELISFFKDFLSADVYFNTSWLVVIKKKNDGIRKSMYNRKSRVLYTFYDDPQIKSLRIDSIFVFYKRDPKLLAAKDTLQKLIGIVISPHEISTVKGFKCHKEYFKQSTHENVTDEIWVSSFMKAPNLISHDHLYFLNEGIPIEILLDLAEIKITWGVVEILPVSRKDKIFIMDPSGYTVKVMDTKALMYEEIHFIHTYEPK